MAERVTLVRGRWRLPGTLDDAAREVPRLAGEVLRALGHRFAFSRSHARASTASGDTQGAASAGPRQAQFERLFLRYQEPLHNYLYGMTRDREWTADLVQETFLRAYASTSDLATIHYPQAWLYRIATNLALSGLKRRQRFGWLALGAVEPEMGEAHQGSWRPPRITPAEGQDLAATVAERDAVWAVLAELPPRWRAVLLLQTTSGFEVREIAAQLHLSEENVRKLLFRAKERFRAIHARREREGGAR